MINKNTTILFATFSPWINGKRLPTNGSVEPLRDFLRKRIKKLVIIDQVTPGSDLVMPRIEVYKNLSSVRVEKPSWWLYLFTPLLKLKKNPGKTYLIYKIRDFLSVIDWGLKDKSKYDFFIGLESINALAGIFLRKIGLVKRVIYYVSDYSPNRYPQKWFNSLYLFLDRFSATNADYIWDVSKAMQPARIKAGLNSQKSAPVIHVPNGLYPNQIKVNPLPRIKPFTLVYMGTLGMENGPDLAIETLPMVIRKFPRIVLYIVGGNQEDILRLKQLAKKLYVEKAVKFFGFVPKANKMSELIRSCYLGLAPYRTIAGSPRYYGDAGKIRAYAAAGLPIITTAVPPLGREIVEFGAGVMVRDKPAEFAKAIINIFNHKQLYLRLRKKAIEFARNNTWENTFMQAFIKMP